MVERAARHRGDDTSSAESSISSAAEDPAQEPLVVQGHSRFACTGPWGKWHCVAPNPDGGPLRTACGVFLGVAAQFSDQPRGDICRRRACR